MIATEYAAQEAAVATPSAIPFEPPAMWPEPAATRPTPPKETAAPSQNRAPGRSVPRPSPRSAAKIGVAPRISPIVEAVVPSSA